MKKGFTMIELLGVFTLTGIILILAVPQITSLLKKSNDEEYQTFLNSTYLAAEAYIEDTQMEIPKGNYVTIKIETLITSGFLKSTLVNPKNDKQVSHSDNKNKNIVVTRNSDNVLKYSLQD